MPVNSWRSTKRDERDVLEVMRRQQEAANEWKRRRQKRQRHIEDLSDRREEGGFTLEESARALQVAESISERFPTLDDWAVDEAVAFLFGTGVSKQEMAEAAVLVHWDKLEFDPDATAMRKARRLAKVAADARVP